MGRRELREEMQRTWVVYEPAKPGTPFRKAALERAESRPLSEPVVESATSLPPATDSASGSGSVTLAKAEDVKTFRVGDRRQIADMTEEEAAAIFGRPVYETWKRDRQEKRVAWGTATITSIDRKTGTLTYEGDL